MDVFIALSYLNKISLFAFIITAGFLIYQFYLLRKEASRQPKKQPPIPDFNENAKVDLLNYTKLPSSMASEPAPIIKKETKTVPIMIGAGLLVLTLAVFLILNSRKPAPEISTKVPTPTLSVKPTLTVSKIPTPSKFLVGGLTTTPGISPTVLLTPTKTSTPTPTIRLTPTSVSSLTPTASAESNLTITPTEVILAVISPTASPTAGLSTTVTISPTTVENLPLTGVIDKGLIFFGVALSLIVISFAF
ncbi:hypothetical protein HZA76_04165 [Candidatus Roizmanbacteria bacterium]|nr:hypothetical protein [Candidatus Roizmanbacteria bacterium]